MYLADTNIFLELLFEQNKADEVSRFLKEIPLEKIFLSEFSLFSIGLALMNRKKSDLFLKFVDDLFVNGQLRSLKLDSAEMKQLVEHARRFNLDFDDAYQYTVANKHSLTLVSFDKDFDRTERGRKTPSEVLT